MAEESSIQFDDVFSGELEDVVARRKARKLPAEGVDFSTFDSETRKSKYPPSTKRGLIGISLSGGGIRSAAFCLGVLQALEAKWQLMKRVDYLSTVSGGGYLGSSVAVGMSKSKTGVFPFPSQLGKEEGESIGHLRDYSNYLIAGKFWDYLGSVGAIFIGLVANVMLVLPLLLIFAGATLFFGKCFSSLATNSAFWEGDNILGLNGRFVVTRYVLILALIVAMLIVVVWSIIATLRNGSETAWHRIWWRRTAAIVLFVPVAFAFIELQPVAVNWLAQATKPEGGSNFVELFTSWLGAASAALAAAGSWISKLAKQGEKGSSRGALLSRLTGKTLYAVAGIVVPLFLWLIYLYLVKWGAPDDAGVYSGAPSWLNNLFDTSKPGEEANGSLNFSIEKIYLIYLMIGSFLISISFFLPPNCFTLYFLYRDRLARGFVAVPFKSSGQVATSKKFVLSDLEAKRCPNVLINAALNIQSDRKLNQRRRHADFFTFGRRYCGSSATGYCDTKTLEEKDKNLDVATAMAISGAAASANMGSKTRKLLVFSLAILNIRLGYWLPNPRIVKAGQSIGRFGGGIRWFYQEVFGLLSAESDKIYLSDGGHIENLGIYELIRRRCKVIIAVDGESDQSLNFSSFVKLQQYVRIDMGVRIEMDWDKIGKTAPDPSGQAQEESAPHCAIGLIHYSSEEVSEEERETGILIYIKSSVTGDENDYIRDYKRRNPTFPHQSTGDQFFSEEQFEVYRALGFHAAGGLFDGKGSVQGAASGGAAFQAQIAKELKNTLDLNTAIRWT